VPASFFPARPRRNLGLPGGGILGYAFAKCNILATRKGRVALGWTEVAYCRATVTIEQIRSVGLR